MNVVIHDVSFLESNRRSVLHAQFHGVYSIDSKTHLLEGTHLLVNYDAGTGSSIALFSLPDSCHHDIVIPRLLELHVSAPSLHLRLAIGPLTF